MKVKYIGGSSLYGPINKLQNALSFNYFANTQTFDPRADTLAVEKSKKDRKRIFQEIRTESAVELKKRLTKHSLALKFLTFDELSKLKKIEPHSFVVIDE